MQLGKIIISALLSLSMSLALATLRMELTQGVGGGIPIVVLPFKGGMPSGQFTDIVKHDLQLSGYFNLVEDNAPANDLSFWQAKKVDNVLSGAIQLASALKQQVSVNLLNTFTDADTAKTLINQQLTGEQHQSRELAHHVSDMVYEKLTGHKGVFNTKIAYVVVERKVGQPVHYRLELSDVDGENPQTILRSDRPLMSPAWSADGRNLAYVSFEHDRAAIYLQTLATGERKRLASFKGINGAPAFSPDGSQLALVLSKTGAPKIYTLNLSSGQLTQVTEGTSIDTEPSWSPDGSQLLFTSNRSGGAQIYSRDMRSGHIKRMTFEGQYNARASFTPNGERIVMQHHDDFGFHVAVQSLKTGRITILAQKVADAESPSIAPNGQYVLFAGHEGGRDVLEMVSIDGRVHMRLPAAHASVQEPVWSPFLRWI